MHFSPNSGFEKFHFCQIPFSPNSDFAKSSFRQILLSPKLCFRRIPFSSNFVFANFIFIFKGSNKSSNIHMKIQDCILNFYNLKNIFLFRNISRVKHVYVHELTIGFVLFLLDVSVFLFAPSTRRE